jgi:hypothetical protein
MSCTLLSGDRALGIVNRNLVVYLSEEKENLESLQSHVPADCRGMDAESEITGGLGIIGPTVLVADVKTGFVIVNQNFHTPPR